MTSKGSMNEWGWLGNEKVVKTGKVANRGRKGRERKILARILTSLYFWKSLTLASGQATLRKHPRCFHHLLTPSQAPGSPHSIEVPCPGKRLYLKPFNTHTCKSSSSNKLMQSNWTKKSCSCMPTSQPEVEIIQFVTSWTVYNQLFFMLGSPSIFNGKGASSSTALAPCLQTHD